MATDQLIFADLNQPDGQVALTTRLWVALIARLWPAPIARLRVALTTRLCLAHTTPANDTALLCRLVDRWNPGVDACRAPIDRAVNASANLL